jgi:hypothetical protein
MCAVEMVSRGVIYEPSSMTIGSGIYYYSNYLGDCSVGITDRWIYGICR